MNETIKTIMSRRSVRGFCAKQIEVEILQKIMDCGLSAPSANNTQNWHFSVVTNAAMIDEINGDAIKSLDSAAVERMRARFGGAEQFSLFYNAPTIVLVSTDSANKWGKYNAAFATQNICLAAESLGLGSIIVGLITPLFTTEQGAKYFKRLNIPEGYNVEYAIAMGHKAMDMPSVPRADGRITYIK